MRYGGRWRYGQVVGVVGEPAVAGGRSPTTVPVALVGLGDIGLSAHLPALLRHPAVSVPLLVDPDRGRRDLALDRVAEHRCGRAGAGGSPAIAADVEAILADGRIRAAVLATPPWVTTALAGRLLRAGLHVLAEKPVAVSASSAGPLLALNPAEQARLQVGLTYRHDPAIAQLRTWIADGVFGGPLLVRAHIYDEARDLADPAHTARIRATLGHGSPVIHEGAHVFDWLRFLLGDPVAVADAWQIVTDADLPAANLTGARISYPGSATALVEFGWLTDRLPRCELSFLGPRAHAVLDGFTFALTLHARDGDRQIRYPGTRTDRSFDRQLDRFVDLVTGRAPHAEPGLHDALASLRIAEQVVAAAHGSTETM
jgi:myo-inositol 2-dehydrogenase / D-chiro-inositol 1-dehydrogenase